MGGSQGCFLRCFISIEAKSNSDAAVHSDPKNEKNVNDTYLNYTNSVPSPSPFYFSLSYDQGRQIGTKGRQYST